MSIIVTKSGRRREAPRSIDPDLARDIIRGLDSDGRVVVDVFGVPNQPAPFLFGLTLCCDAYDKGIEDGIVCRACYSDDDTGSYLYPVEDGTFPGLDPIDHWED